MPALKWLVSAGATRQNAGDRIGKPMVDRRDFFRQIATQYRQLAEIAGNPEIKQRMLDMDEDNTPISSPRLALRAARRPPSGEEREGGLPVI